MGSRLLNGSPQLSVRVTLLPLSLIVMLSTVILGTLLGTPTHQTLHTYVCINIHTIMYTSVVNLDVFTKPVIGSLIVEY